MNTAHRAAIDRNAAIATDSILNRARNLAHLNTADAIEQLTQSLVRGQTGREGFAATLAALAVYVVASLEGAAGESAQTGRTEIELLLSGTGYEVDELGDRIAAGYTLRDAVISALAAYDRRGDLARAIEFRAQRAEAALRLAGVHVPAERDGVWSPCTEALLDHLPEWACGKLPRRDRGDGTGHNHWVPSRREPQS